MVFAETPVLRAICPMVSVVSPDPLTLTFSRSSPLFVCMVFPCPVRLASFCQQRTRSRNWKVKARSSRNSMAASWRMLYDASRCAERLSISTPFGHLLSITEVLDMKKGLRLWFYLEAILGIIAGVLFVVTLINQEWIETVFRVDPDQGSGALEWFVVG